MPRPPLQTRATLLSCARAHGRFGHIGIADHCARAGSVCRRPRATQVHPPTPLARPLPSAVASSHPFSPPAHIRVAACSAGGDYAFSSTLMVKESLHMLTGGVWQHGLAVRLQIGTILCACCADTVPLCVCLKFCSPYGRRIGLNAHVGAPIGVVWECGRPCRRSRGRQGRAGGVTVQGNSLPN